MPRRIEEEKGAAGVEKGRGLAAPAGAMAEVRRGGDPWGSVEAEEGSLGIVCGLKKSFEPASEAVELIEPVVSVLARGVVESKTSGVLERGGEQKSRGIDGARSEEESLGIARRVELEELVKGEVVGGVGQGPQDRRGEGSERFVGVRGEPGSEAREQDGEGLIAVSERREILDERRAFIDDGEARNGRIVGVFEELARGGSEHVGEANVHVDLDGSRGLLVEPVSGARPLGERVEGALGASGAEELTNGAQRSETLGQVETSAEVFGGTVGVDEAKARDTLGSGSCEAAAV